jgi:flavin reductase (DIM6/NTAB) family NADH-FMN oxidoreductase RutF
MKVVKLPYRLLHPRPVVLIVAKADKGNAMALAWGTPIEEDVVGIAMYRENFTYKLIKQTKEFTINIPTKKLAKEVWLAGTRSGKKVDKEKLLGLTFEKGVKINTPHIKECIGFLECRVMKEIELEEHSFFIAEVVAAFANEQFDKIWKEETEILMHVGKNLFCTPSKYFTI